MKSREEYEASIFAKRDALLAKRHKRITAIATASCIAVCFITAFAFLPRRISTDLTVTEGVANITVQTLAVTEPKTTAHIEDAEGEVYTFFSMFSEQAYTKPHYSEKQLANVEDYAGEVADEAKKPSATKKASSSDVEIAVEAEKTTKRNFGFYPEWMKDEYDFYREDDVTPDSDESFTTEEITDKAKSYLSDELKSGIIEKHNMVTVSRSADGTEIYTAWFYTDGMQIKVELDSDNLELIEITEKPLTDTHTTPAYIPTTAKSAYTPTTAAPAYMPQ